MDDRFLTGAVLGAETKVCGYRLTSLTPWHHVLLRAIDSPILNPDAPKDVDDVLVFLKIAKSAWPKAPDLRPRLLDIWWHWRMKKPKVAKKQMERLREWIEAQLCIPQFWESDKDKSSKISAPPVFAIIVGLVSKGNIQLHDAWNMRMSEVRWYDATLAELNGADIKFAYEGEADKIKEQLSDIDEEKAIEIAKRNLPPKQFEKWLEARKAEQIKEDK